ncbi:amino acid adenylation domain-containing protein [Burkholderia glumae]|uniref:Amino acid adenylation domain-containing protein n=1 Tax=Burkholderia glumae TaxID=337 RepID=A0AAP9Y543_BURGL|nr:amino acid adenylation domain-containing protein [Burkholderia glumae]ACR28839.1 Peptide synthetase [Burkholderia glumae BGR1]AJY65782.1 amino acid adenylation domain protein [Burkholderia glumae LMG 2196 = ATCC 33617]KHJ64352.1 amino acid adenylation protein [Burkholderia glumae]MCM2483278.1 amino acid adenylation domain-containing protein [Burkholderia glumae]MCM2506595.1 amino acid adenylation domain-containing protein [Burkholderia glumae]
MTSVSVNRLFDSQARLNPGAIAVSGGGTHLTYAQLARCADHLARRLVEAGVRPLDRVLLCLPRSLDAVIAMLAVAKTGAAFVPVDPSYAAPVLHAYALDSGARYALVRPGEGAALGEAARLIEAHDLAAARDADAPVVDAGHDGEAPVYVMFTSGSTGRPKGVIVPHRGVVRLVRDTNYIRIDATDTLALLSPITFDASTFEIWGALLNGARLAVYQEPGFDPNAVGRLVAEQRVTVMWLTAALFHLVARRFVRLLDGVRVLLAGGDVLHAKAVHAVFDAHPGIILVNGYGPTENTTFTCCHVMRNAERPQGSVPIGRAITGTTLWVLDEALQPVPDGTEGELCVGGAGVALGYLNAPEATRAAFLTWPHQHGLLYRTGDRVRRGHDGVVEFLGRKDRLVKIRGYRVSLDELQKVIATIPGVEEAIVSVSEDTLGERRLTATLQAADAGPEQQAFVRRELRKRVPPFQIPDEIHIHSHLPLNANGKLDRHRVPAA